MCYMLHFLPCNYSKNIGWIDPSDPVRPTDPSDPSDPVRPRPTPSDLSDPSDRACLLFLLSGKMATFTLSELASGPFLPLKII